MALVLRILKDDTPDIRTIVLKAKKSIDDSIIVTDHPELDVLILPAENKVVAIAKEQLDDEVYETQERLFKHLVSDGVVKYDSVQAGNIFMSLEATLLQALQGDKIQYLLYSLFNFMKKDLPFYKDQEIFEKEFEKSLMEPEIDEFTTHETAVAKHAKRRGTMRPHGRQHYYGIGSIYRG
jgi:hypothetical protein